MLRLRPMLLLLACCCLSACMNVATTSAEAVYNRQSLQKNISDQYITMQAYKSLKIKTDEFKDANIAIATFDGDVLLAGQVPDPAQKDKAQAVVAQIDGIRKIYNMLKVANPSSPLTKMSDSWITAKIKSKYIAANDIDASHIKVVTEDGVVYLMGTVLPSEADAAVDIARNTDGVASVVKIFWYMHIDKAAT